MSTAQRLAHQRLIRRASRIEWTRVLLGRIPTPAVSSTTTLQTGLASLQACSSTHDLTLRQLISVPTGKGPPTLLRIHPYLDEMVLINSSGWSVWALADCRQLAPYSRASAISSLITSSGNRRRRGLVSSRTNGTFDEYGMKEEDVEGASWMASEGDESACNYTEEARKYHTFSWEQGKVSVI
ncbi:unnamed protein product [Protopolystoma xenopodis]|uniref:Uncharacterized protein n=1 Tax=Protopolystoma xenopodis TaxID=117903 RepID=A0A3S4ZYS0_9PLAT|nr:unnamed protein product [Protopolystoma xenopodis]